MQRVLWALMFLCFTPIVSAQTILVLGDSLSAAYNMQLEQGWVHLLKTRLGNQPRGYRLVNASISGDTTASGLARLPGTLAAHQPDVVILALGANDGLRGLSLEQTRQNLASMIELARQQGRQILLAGMQLPPNYGPFYSNKFKAIYQDLATTYQVSFIPFLLDQVGDKHELTQADGLHPNAQAQPVILKNVWSHLEPMLESVGHVDENAMPEK